MNLKYLFIPVFLFTTFIVSCSTSGIQQQDLNQTIEINTEANSNIISNKNEEYLKNKWEKLNKKSIKEHISFIKMIDDTSTENQKLKEIAEISLNALLDEKVKKFIDIKYKNYSQYSDYEIVALDGISCCKFYEFLKLPVLNKNPNSGHKDITFRIVQNNKYKNSFDFKFKIGKYNLSVTFKSYKNKLIIMEYQKNEEIDPVDWEKSVFKFAELFRAYPKLEYIDVEMFEKL